MTSRRFPEWVEPIALKLRHSRAEVVELARSIPGEAWVKPSPNEGWTYKDLLAHLATGDWLCQTGLRAVIANEPMDIAALPDRDAANAPFVGERGHRSIDELIAEVEAEGEETQGLLARLTEADEEVRQKDVPMNLGEYLRFFPSHDKRHVAELRTALEKQD